MKDRDFDLDSGDLRLPRQYTSPRQVDSSMLIDDSARYLGDAVKKGIDSFNKRLESIEAAKNANTEFIVGLQAQAQSLDNLDDNNVSNQVKDIMMSEIDDLSLLGYNSIGRDQTEYIKRKSQLINSTKNLLENLANKDEQASGYKKVYENGQAANQVSQLTPRVNQEYLKDILLNNGRGSKVEYKNGAFIVSFTSKDNETLTFNASNDINATKKGAAPLIQYVNDFDPSYKTSYARIVAKYKPRLSQVTKTDDDGNTVVTKATEYNLIRGEIIKELVNDPNFAANATVDETQFLRGKGVQGIEEIYKINLDDNNASLKLNDEIKNQRANYIANLYLPKDQQTAISTTEPKAVDNTSVIVQRLKNLNSQKERDHEKDQAALKRKHELMMKNYERGEIEVDLKTIVDRNLLHVKQAFSMPGAPGKGGSEAQVGKFNDAIVKMINEANRGRTTGGTFKPGESVDYKIDGENIIDMFGNNVNYQTPFGMLDYLNSVVGVEGYTGEAKNLARSYVNRRQNELNRPTQEQFNKLKEKAIKDYPNSTTPIYLMQPDGNIVIYDPDNKFKSIGAQGTTGATGATGATGVTGNP